MVKQCLACAKIISAHLEFHKFCNRECWLLYSVQQRLTSIEKNKGICHYCKKTNLPHLTKISSRYFICRECCADRARKYYKTKHGKKAVYKASKKSMLKFPEKQRARVKLNYAVKIGKINKPKKCEVCKKIGKLHGHHHDYSKPLEVKWVCTGCHADIHNDKKNT